MRGDDEYDFTFYSISCSTPTTRSMLVQEQLGGLLGAHLEMLCLSLTAQSGTY